MPTKKKTSDSGKERRRTVRRDVLETFHVFIVLATAGGRKIYLRDVSEGGLAFIAEDIDDFKSGETVECFFYLNPSLRIPLKVRVQHISTETDGSKKVGCEIKDQSTKAYKAYAAFVSLLGDLSALEEAR